MSGITVTLPEIKLVGITCRTNNKHLFESDPGTNKVAQTVQQYFHKGLSAKISHKKTPGTTYCAYTNYENDLNGDFTYFIGETVTSFEGVSSEFETLIIPPQTYAKFTNSPGPMPAVCIELWQTIWKTSSSELGGERSYITDFELYNERSSDHQNTILDIYIGIKK
jgi:predicted transcriptional regulator YdeE